MATSYHTETRLFGKTAIYNGRCHNFNRVAIAAALLYRPDISSEPITVRHEYDLEKYGGLTPFDRAIIYEIFPDDNLSWEPGYVPFGALKLCD